MAPLPVLFPVRGVVQPYAWGGHHFIPALLGENSGDGRPQAEYWLGAHPKAPSMLPSGEALDRFITEDAPALLGQRVAQTFGRLPYLLKVLDVRQMLSIQVHPDKASAEAGFAAENAAGIPLDAPHRNYKDDNHKPELMVALSDFWLLHGFRSKTAIVEQLAAVPEWGGLEATFITYGYEGLYRKVMILPQEKVNELLAPLLERVLPRYRQGLLDKNHPDFWAARAAETYCANGQYDRGIFSIYFFNLLHLKKGEGIYQAAGLPHAYLEGQNVEIMANSDNVLRAGLTDKHMDVPELMRHTKFEETVPDIIRPTGAASTSFLTPAREFALEQVGWKINGQRTHTAEGPEIILVLDGTLQLQGEGVALKLEKGGAAFLRAGASVQLTALSDTEFFRAFAPVEVV